MSLIDKIKSLCLLGNNGSRGKRLCVIDGASLFNGRSSKIGPREQIQTLQQLSRFAKQENVKVCAVFEGKPLREVSSGGEYKGVIVYFTNRSVKVSEIIVKLVRGKFRRFDVLVVTPSADLEREVFKLGGSAMKAATLKKALEGSSSGGRENTRSSSRKRPRRRTNKQQTRRSSNSNNKTSESSGDNAVRELIDLVE